MLQDENARSHA